MQRPDSPLSGRCRLQGGRWVAEWSWPYSTLLKVVDGDTLDMSLERDLGFGASATFPVRLRLNRINAPELSSVRGKAARDALAGLLAGVELSVTTVKPYKYGGPAGMAGEWMAEIVLPDGRNVSDVLVSEEHAVYWDGTGPRPDDE